MSGSKRNHYVKAVQTRVGMGVGGPAFWWEEKTAPPLSVIVLRHKGTTFLYNVQIFRKLSEKKMYRAAVSYSIIWLLFLAQITYNTLIYYYLYNIFLIILRFLP